MRRFVVLRAGAARSGAPGYGGVLRAALERVSIEFSKRKSLWYSPPFALHSIATLQPLVLALAKVVVIVLAMPLDDEVLAGELPKVPQEPQDLLWIVVLMNHLACCFDF